MLRIRSITPSDLDLFCSLSPPDEAAGFLRQLEALLASGASRPEWCFLAEQNGRPVGRVGYFDEADGLGLFGLSLPWDGDYVDVGARLLAESRRRLGSPRVFVRLNPAFHPRVPARRRVLENAGFQLVQEKIRLAYSGPAPETHLDLIVDRDAFASTLTRTFEGTLDRLDQEGVARDAYSAELESEMEEPALFGAIPGAGVVAAYRFEDATGVIAYVGVAPERRGQGLGRELAAVGASFLLGRGLERVIADVDVVNEPMLAAFRGLGFAEETRLFVYRT